MLLFKKKFLPAIRSGQKTQTIRLWKHRRMRPGQRSYIPGVGHIRLIAVDEVDLAQLTDADARPDGFDTADQLRGGNRPALSPAARGRIPGLPNPLPAGAGRRGAKARDEGMTNERMPNDAVCASSFETFVIPSSFDPVIRHSFLTVPPFSAATGRCPATIGPPPGDSAQWPG